MCPDADPLAKFIALVPFRDRKKSGYIILKVRRLLKEQIESHAPISVFLKYCSEIKKIFTNTPLSLRCTLKTQIIDAINKCLESPESVAVLTLVLCIIEFNVLRNSDRCDLEAMDILKTVEDVNSVVKALTAIFKEKRTNILSLYSWCIGILVFTYRTCVLWCASQDCFDLTKSPLETFIPIDDELLISNSLPALLRMTLKAQTESAPPPICLSRYSLHDLLYACSISDGVINLIKKTSLDGQHQTNTLNNELDSACIIDLQPKVASLKNSENVQVPGAQILRDVYHNGSIESVAKNILLIEQRLLDNRALNEEWRQILAETIMSSPSVILRAAVNLPATNTEHVDGSRLYSQIFCGLLKIWSFVFDKRLILKNTPQSYLYLCGFVGPRFQDMELQDLSKAIILETQLLTNYLHIFRSAVLASPHWYFQMLIDVVNAIFDRFQTASSAEELSVIESALCPCIAAVSRTWASLRAEEPDTRPELSRYLRGLLDTIVVRIATFTVGGESLVGGGGSGQKRKWRAVAATATAESKSAEDFRERGTLSPRVRNMLQSGLLYPLLQAVDPWALHQSVIGLRPPSAREVLRNLIGSLREKNLISEVPIASRTPLAHAAVGGLGLRAKMRKRQRRRFPAHQQE